MSDQIDVNQLSNALQQKVDLPSGKSQADIDYVVEYQAPDPNNDYKWYRLYKSVWIEQGGYMNNSGSTGHSITFLKPFANVYYSLNVGINQNVGSAPYWNDFGCERTTTSFYVRVGLNSWEAKGMVAQS